MAGGEQRTGASVARCFAPGQTAHFGTGMAASGEGAKARLKNFC